MLTVISLYVKGKRHEQTKNYIAGDLEIYTLHFGLAFSTIISSHFTFPILNGTHDFHISFEIFIVIMEKKENKKIHLILYGNVLLICEKKSNYLIYITYFIAG